METTEQSERGTSRRSFLLTGAAAGAAAMGAGRLLAEPTPALASGGLTPGDAAILRFLAAAEILETDAWQQYNELGGIQDSEVPGGSGNQAYTDALSVLDEDMAQYIHDNTDDEFTHFTFINAYLQAHGVPTVNLDRFRTLPSSTADGAQQIGRLTNLMRLTVDTFWWTRYRSDSRTPTSGTRSRRPSQGSPSESIRRFRAATPISARPTTCRQSRTPRGFTSRSSSRAARASTPRWPNGSPIRRFSASC
jgi:hypothetical protein